MELEGFEDLSFLKYYNAQEWENRIILGMNTTKNIDYIEKCFKQKLSIIKCFCKKISGRVSLSLPGVELGVSKNLLFFKVGEKLLHALICDILEKRYLSAENFFFCELKPLLFHVMNSEKFHIALCKLVSLFVLFVFKYNSQ